MGALVALVVVSGCGSSGDLGADSPCRDFLQASRDEQNAAIARVADELGTRNALNPFGRMNIDHNCSQDQDRTLGEAVRLTG